MRSYVTTPRPGSLPWTLTGEDRVALQREVLGATKERMVRELCEALEALGRETPLLLILEDCSGAIARPWISSRSWRAGASGQRWS